MPNISYDLEQAKAFFSNRVAFTTGPHELQVMLEGPGSLSNIQVVDVRFPDDFKKSHIPGAINLPKPKWSNTRYLEEHLRKDAVLYLYCYNPTCHLAAEAAVKLTAAGYSVVEVEGGWQTWENFGFAAESSETAEIAA